MIIEMKQCAALVSQEGSREFVLLAKEPLYNIAFKPGVTLVLMLSPSKEEVRSSQVAFPV